MALNAAGRARPDLPTPRRGAPVFLLTCLGLAALLCGLVFVMAVRPQGPYAAAKPALAPAEAPLIGRSEPALPAPAPTASTPDSKSAPVAVARPPAPPKAPTADAVRARMLAVLRRAPGGAITLSVEDDAAAQSYARSLTALFREAGWTVTLNAVSESGPPVHGLSAALGAGPADQAVREAFAAAGFELRPAANPGMVQPPELFVGVPTGAVDRRAARR